ncbi:MAG: helix-turn-helix domain-containing protein [Defluviitaleaceae bacterium]|nr:helix-turn-helix domain-containing protein [Defluviitaleaceae bacterium]
MISSQALQEVLDGLKAITRIDISVLEANGKVVATTVANLLHTNLPSAVDFAKNDADSQVVAGSQYFKVLDKGIVEYIVVIKADHQRAYTIGRLAAFQIEGLIAAYKERFSRSNFMKNLLLDNFLLSDIYSRGKRLSIDGAARRVVYYIDCDGEDETEVSKHIKEGVASKEKDFVTTLDRHYVVLVKELKKREESMDEVLSYATVICDVIFSKTKKKMKVGIGTQAEDLRYVSRSYKEAKMALEVAHIFGLEEQAISYENLGLYRLIHQLPKSLCEMFVKESLDGFALDSMDEETLTTINKFFEYNLNLSETARQLYIHRNTLVYRLDKLQRATNLDLRNFDHALTFKTALLVGKYIAYKEKNKII